MIELDKDHLRETNLDRIREMSAEEIAEYFKDPIICFWCSEATDGICPDNCFEGRLNWLNSPVEESK